MRRNLKAMTRNLVVSHGLALITVAIAIALRVLLVPWLDEKLPFITLFAAIAFIAWVWGRGPALLALIAGGVDITFFVIEPRYSLATEQVEYRIGLFLYCIFGIGIIAMFESMRKSRMRAEEEVTRRRTAESVLAEREALLRVTLGSIGDGVLATDAEGKVTFINAVAKQLTGWTLADAYGQPLEVVFRIVNEDTRALVENPALRALKQGTIVGLANHTILIAKDGSERPIDDSAAPIRDESGHISGAVLVFRDVTKRRQIEQEQQRTLMTLNNLVASAPLGIAIFDEKMRFRHINGPLAEMNGIPAEEHLGKSLAEIVPQLYPHVEPIFHQLLRTGQPLMDQLIEGETAKAPGVKRAWRESWFPIPDIHGHSCGIGVIVREITEERKAEERLQRKNERLHLATEATGVGVWEWNVLTNQILWDAQMFRIYGIPPTDDGYVVYDTWKQAVLPEDFPNQEEQLQALVRRLGSGSREFRIRRADDGQCRRIEAVETVRTNAQGEAEWVVGTNLDVTERRQAQEELQRLANELSEADRRKDEFLATLAHELRNPLAPIRNGLQVIQLQCGGEPAKIEQACMMMDRQLKQLVRLVDDLMDLSRISRGKIELRKEPVLLSTVIESAVETSRPIIEQMTQELTLSLPPQPIIVEADLTRLAQVFLNLLTNAAKYSERGGHIWLVVERQGSDAVVSVKDTGIGIPPDQLPRVFQMFAQVERSLEKSQGGLGIGLHLVKRLVEMHSGTIEARSQGTGHGSEFVVRLPIVVETARLPQQVEPGELANSKSSLSILIVDDNRDSADSLSMMLQIMGHDTHTAYDGQQGLDLAAKLQPDVALLDIGMPKLNGHDVCRRIREQPWGKEIVLIAMTGWGQEEDRRRSHEAGFDHHMVKPVDPGALLQLLAGLSNIAKP